MGYYIALAVLGFLVALSRVCIGTRRLLNRSIKAGNAQ